jgi:hypothetical protein
MPFSKGTYMRKLFALIGLSLLSLSFAHQEIKVGDEYVMFCGKQNEPVYTGIPSGLELLIQTPDGKPVTGMEKSLNIELTSPTGTVVNYTADGNYGPNSFWEATWKEEGTYNTSWILMTPGQYKVHITGFLGDTEVDAFCDDEETWMLADKSAIEIR